MERDFKETFKSFLKKLSEMIAEIIKNAGEILRLLKLSTENAD